MLIKYFVIAVVILGGSAAFAGQTSWDDGSMEPLPANTADITVYRDPNCGCCKDWISHLGRHHFKVIDLPSDQMDAIKKKYAVPKEAASCHTAVIEGYVIEGHVPANDIKRLLRIKPAITGLSVPGMTTGTPGMEMGSRKDPFNVITFDSNGVADIFNSYRDY
ncbi:MAG: CopG family transcriptional regulator [Gammaproteobacteria bacterium RBG_16_57_12]|nr:MAG: CopG family transcriptional regulator [Gammaproteobacteria bacterium RBG_16_57_12]